MSNKKNVLNFIALSFIMILVLAGCANQTVDTVPGNNETGSAETNGNSQEEVAAIQQYTRDEVAQHATKEDCWVTARGMVYDITEFLNVHKMPLDKYCGTGEAYEKDFFGKHGESKNGMLEKFKIGTLK